MNSKLIYGLTLGLALFAVGCGGAEDSSDPVEAAGTTDEITPESTGTLTVEQVQELNEALQCQPGEIACDAASVVECNGDGAPTVLKTCPPGQSCVDAACAQTPQCTKTTCEYDGAYCPDDYPACPYGIQVGDIVENARLMDPISKDEFFIGQHYGETGYLVLIAANGW